MANPHPEPIGVPTPRLAAYRYALKAWRYDPEAPENRAYYGVNAETKLIYGAYYVGLLCFLAIMAHDAHQMLQVLQLG